MGISAITSIILFSEHQLINLGEIMIRFLSKLFCITVYDYESNIFTEVEYQENDKNKPD